MVLSVVRFHFKQKLALITISVRANEMSARNTHLRTDCNNMQKKGAGVQARRRCAHKIQQRSASTFSWRRPALFRRKIIQLVNAKQTFVVSPSWSKGVDAQNLTKVLVESNATENAIITFALPAAATLKATVDDIGHPSKAIFATCGYVGWALLLQLQHDIVASWLANFDAPITRTTSEPEPYRGGPSKLWVCGNELWAVE